ncbi:MAG: hypothetical protein ACYCZV_05070 [Acidimicrobiales bacterium]
MSDDLTAPLGTVGSPGADPEPGGGPASFPVPDDATDVCPNGHVLSVDQVIVRNGHKVCPVCEAQAKIWANPAPRPPAYWSRRTLRVPLALIAAAFFVGALSAAFDIATAASYVTNHLPGAGSSVTSAIFDTISQLALAAGIGWVAYLVGLDERPSDPDNAA